MSRRCRQLVDVNTLRGCDSPNAVAVQFDGMYNNPLYSGVGEKPSGNTNGVLGRWKRHIKIANHKASHQEQNLFKTWPLTWKELCWPLLQSWGLRGKPSHAAHYRWRVQLGQGGYGRPTLWEQPRGQGSNHWSRQLGRSGCRFPLSGRASERKPTHYLDTRYLSESVRKSIKRDEKPLKVMPTAT